ncbi:patatin-like phospholipase family protein [Chitinibacter sp. S2-10]|uniref:patatin-like phospholipase family protein n=1 Tax=Chitinibacter sp. S2-10 TaxID=3373597 RepID=UPI003977D9B8
MAAGQAAASKQKPKIALVLQGGGALGAYHIGAYQALHEAGLEPDWFSGISIGAINACVLAGNKPEHRLSQLEALWEDISRDNMTGLYLHGSLRRLYNQFNFMEAVWMGQPNFWTPRFPSPLLFNDVDPQAASFCDTAPMRNTLQRLANFELINATDGSGARLSLGATKVTTGELKFFDNRTTPKCKIGPEHVLASGSLPPGFPATEVDGELYWDGGCVSNTPLDAIFQDDSDGHTLVFMVDLWDSHGAAPRNMDEVNWRQKQIQYASRSSENIRSLAARHNHRRVLHQLSQKVDVKAVSDHLDLAAHNGNAHFDIVHLIYQPASDQISDSDAEFSRPSILERRNVGYADMKKALAESPWVKKSPNVGTAVHTVRGQQISSAVPA